ncbi:MAG: AAA domain-containing protein [Chitinophagaceae bacterium]
MQNLHPHALHLIKCIELEEKEEANRYQFNQQHTLKSLKAEGLAIHPIKIVNKNFGYADYPEVSFRIPYPIDTNQFRDAVSIELFYHQEECIKGVLLSLDGKQGEFRLYAPDYPDWLEEEGVGIKRSPDQRTTTLMKSAIKNLEEHKQVYDLFLSIHDANTIFNTSKYTLKEIPKFQNHFLNESQQKAIQAILENDSLCILHGPPGTGKTTTLIEAIVQLVRQNEKVLVSAPSNTAVDQVAKGLVAQGVNILRVGNSVKIDEQLLPYTPEGKLADKQIQKEIKALKKRADEFRKMALTYKRKFGKAEREQRSLLFKEVKSIRNEIRKILAYHEEKNYEKAQVILGTPIGLLDSQLSEIVFQTLIIDEAAQCLEPLAWCIFPLAHKYVLAGDPFQLPPTVLSPQAEKIGFNKSILEVCFEKTQAISLLNTQYRMRKAIAGFSSTFFYHDELLTPPALENKHQQHITFFDTAGTGHEEQQGLHGVSLMNEGELHIVEKIIEIEKLAPHEIAFISPYAAQVTLAKEKLPKTIRVSTIDSFQGQEYHTVIVSLVRSNDEGQIGFLQDIRRMNVALTRAQERLYVIGDSATLGTHAFYASFFEYVEKHGAYRSAWELEQ